MTPPSAIALRALLQELRREYVSLAHVARRMCNENLLQRIEDALIAASASPSVPECHREAADRFQSLVAAGVMKPVPLSECEKMPDPDYGLSVDASHPVDTMPVWKLLNEADDEKATWSTAAWQQWFVRLVDAVSGVDLDIERQADASVETPASPHRCSGCGLRWNGTLHGAELCGDCWRKAQPVVHAAVADPPVSPPEEQTR